MTSEALKPPKTIRVPRLFAGYFSNATVLLAGSYAIFAGLVTLCGWAFNIPRLTDWRNDGISMFPNTAVCALVGGIALLLVSGDAARRPWRQILERSMALVLALIGGLTLLQHLLGIHLGIDTLLFDRHWGQRASTAPMRMGPPASLSFFLLGCSLLLTTCGRDARRMASGLAMYVVFIASFSLVGFWFGADQLFGVARLTGIAFQTSTVVAALALGLMTAVPEHGLISLLRRDDAGAVLMRRYLAPIIFVPLLLGRFEAWGRETNLFDGAFGTSIMTLTTIAMLIGLLWWTTNGVSRQAQITRRAQDALRESEQWLRAMFDQAAVGIAVASLNGKFVEVNRKLTEILGYSSEELRAMAVADVTHPEDRSKTRQNMSQLLAGEIPNYVYEKRYLKKSGAAIWSLTTVALIRDQHGKPLQFIGIVEDITSSKQAEDALRQRERLFKTLTSYAPVGIFQTDADGNCLFVNERWCEIAGMSADEAQGKGWAAALHPEDRERVFQAWYDATRAGREFSEEYRFITPDGKVTWLSGSGVALNDEYGRVVGYIGTISDITSRKHAEVALRASEDRYREADKRKDEFLATLAHELRNPLAPIQNAVEILKRADGDRDLNQNVCQMMDRQLAHLVRLVDDLLDVSRITRDKLELRKERVSLASIVQQAIDICSPLIDKQQHELSVSIPSIPIYVQADPVRLAQVFGNLINNACKYTQPNGKIWVSVERHDGKAALRVRDTGIGIAADMLPQVFDMFLQASASPEHTQGGLGIGLTLVKRLIEMHGGTVHAHSDGLGKGSEFVVQLPTVAGEMTIADAPAPVAAALARRRTLVVDDNRDAAISLALLLQLAGHETHTAHDGQEAYEAALQLTPDLLLLDIGMPKMNGYEVCKAIRQQPWGKDIIIVALTGWGQVEDRRRSAEAGFDGHLVKPVQYSDLTKVLEQLAAAAVE